MIIDTFEDKYNLDIILLNLMEFSSSSVIKELSNHDNGFLKYIFESNGIKYSHIFNNDNSKLNYKLKITIKNLSTTKVYKFLIKKRFYKGKVYSLFYILIYTYLKFFKNKKNVYLLSFNENKFNLTDKLFIFESDLLEVQPFLKIRLIMKQMTEKLKILKSSIGILEI